MMEPTGYCWYCGHVIKEGELFCSKKHEEQYNRKQERRIKVGKRAGYGISGSCR